VSHGSVTPYAHAAAPMSPTTAGASRTRSAGRRAVGDASTEDPADESRLTCDVVKAILPATVVPCRGTTPPASRAQ
jgi:hypothetical protein